jgi:hypothetical protein
MHGTGFVGVRLAQEERFKEGKNGCMGRIRFESGVEEFKRRARSNREQAADTSCGENVRWMRMGQLRHGSAGWSALEAAQDI